VQDSGIVVEPIVEGKRWYTPERIPEHMSMTQPVNMQPMSWGHLILNSPEWVAVFASALFAVVTIGVVIWQVCVMKAQVRVMIWQARSSHRNEQTQNRLLRLQHEHEWVRQRNREREELLKLAGKLSSAVSCLKDPRSRSAPQHWYDVQSTAYELESRLSLVDITAFLGVYDHWYPNLRQYLEAVLDVVLDDSKYPQPDSSGWPAPETVQALAAVAERCNPTKILLDLQTAIRMEFYDFKKKWDALLP
jgi:hypothetical protein